MLGGVEPLNPDEVRRAVVAALAEDIGSGDVTTLATVPEGAMAEAMQTIQRGAADIAIAGGGEAKVNPMSIMRQCLTGRAATKYNDMPEAACRPFDADRDGGVIGEGADADGEDQRQPAVVHRSARRRL